MYLPEHLVCDVQVPDARITCQYVFRHHIGSDVLFYCCDMNSGRRRTCEKIVVNDHESTSVDSETTKTLQMHMICQAVLELFCRQTCINVITSYFVLLRRCAAHGIYFQCISNVNYAIISLGNYSIYFILLCLVTPVCSAVYILLVYLKCQLCYHQFRQFNLFQNAVSIYHWIFY